MQDSGLRCTAGRPINFTVLPSGRKFLAVPCPNVSRENQLQLTCTLVTLALPMVAVPFETVQVCPAGWARIATP
jgi:hypothetical protein